MASVATDGVDSAVQIGQALHLQSLMKRKPELLANGEHVTGAVIIDETAKVGAGCSIGPDVSIGPGCVIGDGVRLANCVIMKGCTVRAPSLTTRTHASDACHGDHIVPACRRS